MTITGDYLFVTLILMTLGLNLIQIRRPNILVAFSISMLWFAMAIWLFFSTSPPLSIQEQWVQILVWVFVMLAFVPWLFQMDTEIQNEAGGKRWKEWGAAPITASNWADSYKRDMKRRWSRRRR